MSKKKQRRYEKIDVDEVYRLVQEGELTDEQRVRYFDRMVLEYERRDSELLEEVATLRKENLTLVDGVSWRDRRIARLGAKVEELKEGLQRASKRRGSNGHCGPRRKHQDKYTEAAETESEGLYKVLSTGELLVVGEMDEPDYEAINARYEAMVEAEEVKKAEAWA